MLRNVLLLSAVSLVRVCGAPAETTPGDPSAVVLPAPTQQGGQVGISGGLQVEVAPRPDGQVAVFVKDSAGAPVEANDVRLAVRRPDGERTELALTYVPAEHAYVGRAPGLPAGSYEPEVQVALTAGGPPLRLAAPAVEFAAPAAVPVPQYSGRVQTVGPYTAEVVVAHSREVVLTFRDASGNPVPAAEVTAPSVDVVVGGQRMTVPVQASGQGLVARLPSEPDESVVVEVPTVAVRGVEYHHVVLADVTLVPVLPPALVVAVPVVAVVAPAVEVVAPTPAVVVAPPPAVVVAPPAVVVHAPGVVVAPVGIEVGFGVGVVGPGHGRGHGHGHGRGHGGFRFW